MSNLVDYINELVVQYGDEVEIIKSSYSEEELLSIPKPLREFYCDYERISLPFGDIYAIDSALKKSRQEPFQSEGWFCFGFDHYFSFWLCRLAPEEDGASFTSWDHDVGEIDGAVEKDIIKFLKDEQEEYTEKENENHVSVVLSKLPDNKPEFLANLIEAFSLTVSTQELLDAIEDLPYVVEEDVPIADAKLMIKEAGHPECFDLEY